MQHALQEAVLFTVYPGYEVPHEVLEGLFPLPFVCVAASQEGNVSSLVPAPQPLPYFPGPHGALSVVRYAGTSPNCAPVGTARHAARNANSTQTHVERIIDRNGLSRPAQVIPPVAAWFDKR